MFDEEEEDESLSDSSNEKKHHRGKDVYKDLIRPSAKTQNQSSSIPAHKLATKSASLLKAS